MSHKITGKEPLQKPCNCNTQDVLPSKLDIAIAEYKEMARKAEEARDEFLHKARALEDIAKETNATANKNAILAKFDDITIDTSTLAKDATVAKQGTNPNATNTAILAAVEQGRGTQLMPTAEVVENGVRFHFVTLAQMEKIHIRATGVVGTIGFTLIKGENDFELRFSSDSPQEIAGQLIYDDSIEIVDNVFGTITIPLEGYVVSGVYIDGVDANLLEADINWRLADQQRRYDQIGTAAEAYNTGKTELAANITAKGIPASATETLPELAGKVAQIAQTQTILEGGEIMAAQQFGDGALWNLYQVLADMKTRFMGNGDYSALIVCEYHKGYDSLQLQGADAYYTCDGDFYDTSAPLHVWHDAENGKSNRWVCFLFATEGARLDITNTAISPRSMYIGGHIGTIEYFVNGRLTELVSGIEETDVVDNFITRGYTQDWGLNILMRNIDNIKGLSVSNAGVVFIPVLTLNVLESKESVIADSAVGVYFSRLKSIYHKVTAVKASSAVAIYLPELESKYTLDNRLFVLGSAAKLVYMPKLVSSDGNTADRKALAFGVNCPNIIDVWVGEFNMNLAFYDWNPTNVLADATKKATLVENVKNHILARIADRTNDTQLTCKLILNMYNAIANENVEWQGETMTLADAFLTKNWLLAGA